MIYPSAGGGGSILEADNRIPIEDHYLELNTAHTRINTTLLTAGIDAFAGLAPVHTCNAWNPSVGKGTYTVPVTGRYQSFVCFYGVREATPPQEASLARFLLSYELNGGPVTTWSSVVNGRSQHACENSSSEVFTAGDTLEFSWQLGSAVGNNHRVQMHFCFFLAIPS